MKNIKIYLLFFILISSCGNDEGQFGDLVDINIQISIKDKDKSDLLNPNNQNHFNEDEIRILYMVNDIIVEWYNGNSDAPHGFTIFQHQDEYRFSTSPKDFDTTDFPLIYVKWNESDIDTLKCEMVRKNDNAYVSISKVWFNETEVWNQEIDNDERHFEITK